jgi:hypothetical protein
MQQPDTQTPTTRRPERRAVLILAAQASVDVRTAEKALRGAEIKGLAGERIRAVLEQETAR